MFKVTSFCLHACTQPLSPLTNSFTTFCDMLAHVSIKSLVSWTCVLYNVHTFLHQSPNSVVNWVSGSTGLFGGHKSGEIKSVVSCWRSWTDSRAQSDVRMRNFHCKYLKANKVRKNEEIRKVEYAYNYWKCADAVYQIISKLVHTC